MNHNTIHICELPVKTKAPERIAKRNYTPDDINQMCLDTFGNSIKELKPSLKLMSFDKKLNLHKYQLSCLARHIQKTSFVNTLSHIAELMQIKVHNVNYLLKNKAPIRPKDKPIEVINLTTNRLDVYDSVYDLKALMGHNAYDRIKRHIVAKERNPNIARGILSLTGHRYTFNWADK